MVESLKQEKAEEDEQDKTRPQLLKLNSINGATNSLAQVLPVDQTPTPTKFVRNAEELFQVMEGDAPKSDPSHANPFDKSFKQSTSNGNEPVTIETIDDKETMEISQDENDHEFIEEVVDFSTDDKEDSSDKFKRPDPVTSTLDGEMIHVTTTTINSIAGEGQQYQMLPTAAGQQMLVQIPQTVAPPGTRFVMAQPEMAQAGQANNVLVPAGGLSGAAGGQLIMGAGGQFFMTQPQVMHIQDPSTGAIQQVITQPQQQFVMTQQVADSQSGSLQTIPRPVTTQAVAGAANPPPYTQCVMVSPQIQFVASPQPMVIPSSQPMIINQNGQQFQIINTPSQGVPHGAQLIQTTGGQMGQLIQSPAPKLVTNGQKLDTGSSGGVVMKYLPEDDDDDEDLDSSDVSRRSYSRPSYTHSQVVQLSTESLRAIEEAGAECSSGKRGGPRLNYDELDPKRRRFLERNRMAAARCRERKKQWIISLEFKASELKNENKQIEEDCLRQKTKLDQMREALERHQCHGMSSIDKENNIQSGVEIQTKVIGLEQVVTSSDPVPLKIETAMIES